MRSKILLIIILVFLIGSIINLNNQANTQEKSKMNIAVLPFLIYSNQTEHDYEYALNLSKAVTTKLYYSTKDNIISMAMIDKILKDRDLDDLIDINESYLYLIANEHNWDYVIIPKITINEKDNFRIEGLLYNVSHRKYQNNTVVKGKGFKVNIYDKLDKMTDDLLGSILTFDETQPFLRPAKKNNLDILLYFDVDTASFEYNELKSQYEIFISLLHDIAKGDMIRIGFIFSKEVNGTIKYITQDFKDIEKIDKGSFPNIIDKKKDEEFINSPYIDLGKSIFYLNWNNRKNNYRYLLGFTKKKIGNDIDKITTVLNNNNLIFSYFILEDTNQNIKAFNSTVSQITYGNQIPISYFLEVYEPDYLKMVLYILKNNQVYSFSSDGFYNNNIKSYQTYNIKRELDISKISYDLNIETIQQALDFLYVSGYSNTDDIRKIKYYANISGVIEESLGMLFQKNLELYNKIHIYNNGISLNISLPLEVADIVIRDYYDDYKISKFTNKPLKILIGAKILKSDNSHNFDLDPFSLIFPKHSIYISEDLCKRTFIDFSNNPDYYCNNGIMEKDIWFFEANIVKIGD